MHSLSIRGLDDEALAALKARARQDKTSVNSAVLRVIDEGLGRAAAPQRHRHTDLDALAGTWSAQDLAEFESATAQLEHIDADLWKPAA
jgi:plasmid stability protein